VVFRYPVDPSVDYIKRVHRHSRATRSCIRGKRLTINGEAVAVQGSGYYTDAGSELHAAADLPREVRRQGRTR
jgi:hypothetical protein